MQTVVGEYRLPAELGEDRVAIGHNGVFARLAIGGAVSGFALTACSGGIPANCNERKIACTAGYGCDIQSVKQYDKFWIVKIRSSSADTYHIVIVSKRSCEVEGEAGLVSGH